MGSICGFFRLWDARKNRVSRIENRVLFVQYVLVPRSKNKKVEKNSYSRPRRDLPQKVSIRFRRFSFKTCMLPLLGGASFCARMTEDKKIWISNTEQGISNVEVWNPKQVQLLRVLGALCGQNEKTSLSWARSATLRVDCVEGSKANGICKTKPICQTATWA